MRNASRELTKRGELLCLDQTILRCAQILQRRRQVTRASLHAFKQPHIFNCDYCLVGESRQQLDMLVIERLNCNSAYNKYTDWIAFAQKGQSKVCTKAA